MTKRSNLFLTFSFLFLYSAYAQLKQPDFAFVGHLESIGEFSEGLLYLDQFEGTSDSTQYFRGRFHYQLKDIEKSVSAFRKIPHTNRVLGPGSRFYESIQLVYLGRYSEANFRLLELDSLGRGPQELKLLQLAGICLLQRDIARFDSISTTYNSGFSLLKEHQRALQSIRDDWAHHREKSPLLAGILSAVIPGGGKCYAGNVGEGIMSFATTGIFALQAWEGYRKDGPASVRFILFSSFFGVFYTANIWGTVVTVKMETKEFNTKTDEAILVNMHIPIRIFYK